MHPRLLLASGFRPFFLVAGLSAILSLLPWMVTLSGGWMWPTPWGGMRFHAHEIVHGFAMAAVGGFLLTAVPNWTKTARVQGPMLGALLGAWLLGRFGIWAASVLPAPLVAGFDLLFLPLLLTQIGRPIVQRRNARNYVFLALLAVVFGSSLVDHLDGMQITYLGARLGPRLGAYAILVMVAIIGGRVIPLFTRNALRSAGGEVAIPARPTLQFALLTLASLALLADAFEAPRWLAGALGISAGVLTLVRLAGWRGREARGLPLVWILHVGYLFLGLGLLALGASALTPRVPPGPALHLLGAGAIGTMVMAMMSRAALGHSGRPLEVGAPMVAAYLCVIAGALLRSVGAALAPTYFLVSVVAGGALFSLGYLIYLVVYIPILLSPRADGKPG